MPLYRITPPGEVVEADLVRDEGRTVALIGTGLVMNQPRDIVLRRVPGTVLIEEVGGLIPPDGPAGLTPPPTAPATTSP